jgi:hypothetical protein
MMNRKVDSLSSLTIVQSQDHYTQRTGNFVPFASKKNGLPIRPAVEIAAVVLCSFLTTFAACGTLSAQGTASVATKINQPASGAAIKNGPAPTSPIPAVPAAPAAAGLLTKASFSLCVVIQCQKPAPPVLTQINTQPVDPVNLVAVHPGDYVLVNGQNFLANGPGNRMCAILLTDPRTHTQLQYMLYDPQNPPDLSAHWSDKAVYGMLASNISGYPDQIAQLILTRGDGIESPPVKVMFVAARTYATLPPGDVQLVKCSDAADQNACQGWADYSPPFTPNSQNSWSYYGSHITFMGQNSGSDQYSVNLKNGWVIYGVGFQHSGACPNDAMNLPPASLLAASQVTFAVSWVSQCQLSYAPWIQIMGPAGVPWK